MERLLPGSTNKKIAAALLTGSMILGLSGCGVDREIRVPATGEEIPYDDDPYTRSFLFSKDESADAARVDCGSTTKEEQFRPDGSTIVTCATNSFYELKLVVTPTDQK